MKPTHLLMILLVVALWGFNFVFIRLGLNGVSPLMLCTLRFTFSAIPAVFFVKRPACSWRILIGYGVVMFACQFSLLFLAMTLGMPAGLASLIMQFQVFFTMGFAAFIFKERPGLWKISGALISFLGIVFIAAHTQADITIFGLILTLMASMSWGSGNIISKRIGSTAPFALVTWGSLMASPVILLFTLFIDGPEKMFFSLQNLSWLSMASIAYIVYFSTHIAYSMWSYLLNQYSTATIVPFTLLVPIFGFLGSILFLNESFPAWKIIAVVLVIAGLCFNLLEKNIKNFLRKVTI